MCLLGFKQIVEPYPNFGISNQQLMLPNEGNKFIPRSIILTLAWALILILDFKSLLCMFELHYANENNKKINWKAVWQLDVILSKQTFWLTSLKWTWTNNKQTSWLHWKAMSMVPSAHTLWKASGHSTLAM